jgi:hypothetical protein
MNRCTAQVQWAGIAALTVVAFNNQQQRSFTMKQSFLQFGILLCFAVGNIAREVLTVLFTLYLLYQVVRRGFPKLWWKSIANEVRMGRHEYNHAFAVAFYGAMEKAGAKKAPRR